MEFQKSPSAIVKCVAFGLELSYPSRAQRNGSDATSDAHPVAPAVGVFRHGRCALGRNRLQRETVFPTKNFKAQFSGNFSLQF